MLKPRYPFFLANRPETPNADLAVTDKYSGEVATRVAMATPADIDRAIAAAVAAARPMAELAAYERKAVLEHCVTRFRERREELAMSLCIEAGKPIRDAEGEVIRLIDTFGIAAEESVRIGGRGPAPRHQPSRAGLPRLLEARPDRAVLVHQPLQFPAQPGRAQGGAGPRRGLPVRSQAGEPDAGRRAHHRRGARGNGSARRRLRGAAVPARRGPACSRPTSGLKLLSFTGSPGVGWDLKAKAGRKPVVLELGGNAAVIVDGDADLDDAVARIVFGAFYQSGQSCISVQRVLIHESVYDDARDRLVKAVRSLKTGDPKDRDTFIGPMISEAEASRLDGWIHAAVDAGASLLCGGRRDGTLLEATLLEDVPDDARVSCEEAFGPVALLSSFGDFDNALDRVNDSRFGLQAGIFTRDLYKAQRAWDRLEVGGVVIGDVPSYRVDNMPYGGVKESGLGREGIRFAIEDMTELRLMVVRTPGA